MNWLKQIGLWFLYGIAWTLSACLWLARQGMKRLGNEELWNLHDLLEELDTSSTLEFEIADAYGDPLIGRLTLQNYEMSPDVKVDILSRHLTNAMHEGRQNHNNIIVRRDAILGRMSTESLELNKDDPAESLKQGGELRVVDPPMGFEELREELDNAQTAEELQAVAKHIKQAQEAGTFPATDDVPP